MSTRQRDLNEFPGHFELQRKQGMPEYIFFNLVNKRLVISVPGNNGGNVNFNEQFSFYSALYFSHFLSS